MQNVVFKKLHVEGFGSIATPLKVNLSRKGLYLVTGHNGSGKTSIFNALVWCLYGTHVKGGVAEDISTYQTLREKNHKGTKVSLSLIANDEEYLIEREKDYKEEKAKRSGLKVFKHGEELTDLSSIPLAEEYIQTTIMSVDREIFMSAYFFGQNILRFLGLSDRERKSVLSSLVEDACVSNLQSAMSEKCEELKEQQQEAHNKIQLYEERLKSEQEHLEANEECSKANRDKEERDKQQTKREIEIAKAKLAKLKPECEIDTKAYVTLRETQKIYQSRKLDLEEKRRPIEKLSRTSVLAKQKLSEKLHQRNDLEGELKKMSEAQIDCSKCGHTMNAYPEQDIVALTAKLSQIEKEISRLIHEVRTSKEELSAIHDEVDEMRWQLGECPEERLTDALQDKIREKQGEITSLEALLLNHEERLSALDKNTLYHIDIDKLKEKIQEAKAGMKEVSAKQETLKKEHGLFKGVKTLTSGNKFYSYLLNGFLTELNKQLNYYSNSFHMSVEASIDTNKVSLPLCVRVKQEEGVVTPYTSLSGGERSRVDLIFAFAISTVFQSKKLNLNFLLLDEVFEGLDASGREVLVNCIRARQASFSGAIFVISHGNFFSGFADGELEVSKTPSGTVLEEH